MQNNRLGKVNVAAAKLPRSHFNFSRDVNTTASFGDIQPLQCKLLPAGTKTVCGVESFARLAPMVSPTFARMSWEVCHYWVGMSDLLENYSSMVAQKEVSYGANTFVPENMPHMALKDLTAWMFIGSTVGLADVYIADSGTYKGQYVYNSNNSFLPQQQSVITEDIDQLVADHVISRNTSIPQFGGYSGYGFNLSAFFANENNISNFVPIANTCDLDFYPSSSAATLANRDHQPVTAENADFIWYDSAVPVSDGTTRVVCYLFRLSAFGKRLRKAIIGLGYQPNLDSDIEVNILPLFALWKSYFDFYGIQLYQNYNSTPCAALLRQCDYANKVDFTHLIGLHTSATMIDVDTRLMWLEFIYDLGNMWVTSQQDFVSAHTRTQTISAQSHLSDSFVDVRAVANDSSTHPFVMDNTSSYGTAQTENGVTVRSAKLEDGSHAAIGSVLHGQLDSEYLKRLYKWTNRNTIAGAKIADLLRAQGLGDYVDSTKSNFIGKTTMSIKVDDVTSMADTYSSSAGTGNVLGEYAGKGIGYQADKKKFTFENDEPGYWITFAAIVPESGYCQQLDPSLLAVGAWDVYRPDFDGLGLEATPKLCVVGSSDTSVGGSSDSMNSTFGLVPRYTGFKVAPNIANGDFTIRGARSAYQPYMLDKFLDVNGQSFRSKVLSNDSAVCVYRATQFFSSDMFPVASPIWRFLTRYPWLGNLNRIFAYVGENVDKAYSISGDAGHEYVSGKWETTYEASDNFILHNVVNMQSYAPMLAIEDSFETMLDGERSNTAIAKA